MKCRIFDNINNEWINYSEPIYTKLSGVYGYISVSLMDVHFFWIDNDSNIICYDNMTYRFEVEYKLK